MTASARTTTPGCAPSSTASASNTNSPPSTEYYRAGRFDAALRRVLERYDEIVTAVILPTLGPERRATYSPVPADPPANRPW